MFSGLITNNSFICFVPHFYSFNLKSWLLLSFGIMIFLPFVPNGVTHPFYSIATRPWRQPYTWNPWNSYSTLGYSEIALLTHLFSFILSFLVLDSL